MYLLVSFEHHVVLSSRGAQHCSLCEKKKVNLYSVHVHEHTYDHTGTRNQMQVARVDDIPILSSRSAPSLHRARIFSSSFSSSSSFHQISVYQEHDKRNRDRCGHPSRQLGPGSSAAGVSKLKHPPGQISPTFRLPPVIVTLTKRRVYWMRFLARPLGVFFFSCGSTLGVCDLTLPARARDP